MVIVRCTLAHQGHNDEAIVEELYDTKKATTSRASGYPRYVSTEYKRRYKRTDLVDIPDDMSWGSTWLHYSLI